jgi:hypothetical protein
MAICSACVGRPIASPFNKPNLEMCKVRWKWASGSLLSIALCREASFAQDLFYETVSLGFLFSFHSHICYILIKLYSKAEFTEIKFEYGLMKIGNQSRNHFYFFDCAPKDQSTCSSLVSAPLISTLVFLAYSLSGGTDGSSTCQEKRWKQRDPTHVPCTHAG